MTTVGTCMKVRLRVSCKRSIASKRPRKVNLGKRLDDNRKSSEEQEKTIIREHIEWKDDQTVRKENPMTLPKIS